ncbi:MAG TPA: sortase [Euzebyales bacterium]|nr:sortase [Euzebyales bacterium]
MTPSQMSSRRPSPSYGAQRPAIGDPVATMRWRNYEFVVVEGVGSDQLAIGPGRYPSTALPGRPGNFAMAGHRVSYGAPFHDLDLLQPGDRIDVENRAGRLFVYRVVDFAVVNPDETWVISRDPLGTNRPMLTMTTCHPKLSDRQRLVVWAALDESRNAATAAG